MPEARRMIWRSSMFCRLRRLGWRDVVVGAGFAGHSGFGFRGAGFCDDVCEDDVVYRPAEMLSVDLVSGDYQVSISMAWQLERERMARGGRHLTVRNSQVGFDPESPSHPGCLAVRGRRRPRRARIWHARHRARSLWPGRGLQARHSARPCGRPRRRRCSSMRRTTRSSTYPSSRV